MEVTVVRRERMLRGISRQGPGLSWSEADLKLLGTMSDAALAARIGKAPNAVWMQRRKRNIPAVGLSTKKARHYWTARQLAWLGKLPDATIAERIGLDPTTVRFKRESLCIAPTQKGGPRGHEWTKQELALLGKLSDTDVAKKIGVHRHRVALKRQQLGRENPTAKATANRWTPERIAQLGRVPDAVVAKEMGLAKGTVSAYRLRQGIRRQSGHAATAARPLWTAAQIKRLGQVPDPEIAAELGLTRSAVASVRNRLGIASHRANRRAAANLIVESDVPLLGHKDANSSSLPTMPRAKAAKSRSKPSSDETQKAVVK